MALSPAEKQRRYRERAKLIPTVPAEFSGALQSAYLRGFDDAAAGRGPVPVGDLPLDQAMAYVCGGMDWPGHDA